MLWSIAWREPCDSRQGCLTHRALDESAIEPRFKPSLRVSSHSKTRKLAVCGMSVTSGYGLVTLDSSRNLMQAGFSARMVWPVGLSMPVPPSMRNEWMVLLS